MDEIKAFLNLAQEYWVVTLVVSLFILSIFSQLRSGASTTDIKITTSVNPKSDFGRHFNRSTSPINTSKIEFTSADAAFEPVMNALMKGDKINAIKLVREAKCLSLVDAKLFIESLDSIKDKITSHKV